MKHLKLYEFEKPNNEFSSENDYIILKKAQEILDSYIGQKFDNIISELNEKDVDYIEWSDIQIIMWKLKNK